MIVLSVLNRLVNDSNTSSQEDTSRLTRNPRDRAPLVTKAEFEKYRAAVRRDLEWLLNTRKIAYPLPEGLKEVEHSVYCYGLPDFSNLNLFPGRNEGDRARLAGMIARVITLFEPRILDPRVTVENRPSSDQDLHFHVIGRLKMKPRPEPVFYDTRLDVTRGEYEVEVLGEGRA